MCTLRMPHISAADKGAWAPDEEVPPGDRNYEADHMGEYDTMDEAEEEEEEGEAKDMEQATESDTEILSVPVSGGDVWHC